MSQHSGTSTSVWMHDAALPRFHPLLRDERADVVVIGAGIAGLSVAYHLCLAGRSVVVLDDGPIASGESERSTAHLSTSPEAGYAGLERQHGAFAARHVAESHAAAVHAIDATVRRERIECGFRRVDGHLFVDQSSHQERLQEELAAAHRAGLVDVTLMDHAPIPGFATGPALRFPGQGQFHPGRYLAGLAQAITRDGGRIHTHTHAVGLHGGRPARVQTAQGPQVTADAVVVATHSPVNDRIVLHTKQSAYRTYALAFELLDDEFPIDLFWDTAEPQHHVRRQTGRSPGDLLLVGGEDHRTGQADDAQARYERLEAWARVRFPVGAVHHRWSGQLMKPADGIAFIGHNPLDRGNVYVVTGTSRHGMTGGTIAGLLVTDLLLGRRNPWAELYAPSRVTAQAAEEIVAGNVNAAGQYADWLTAGDETGVSAIGADEGAVVRQGLHKVAAYRDHRGHLHTCSAVCPHLGGIVHWNHGEKAWECPVHGSRFDRFGTVTNGPASADLKRVAPSAAVPTP